MNSLIVVSLIKNEQSSTLASLISNEQSNISVINK